MLLTVFGQGGTVASATNLLYNAVSTPAGIARHPHIDWRLTRTLAGSAVPAAVGGALVNVFLLGDSPAFRLLVAALLLVVAATLALPRPARSAGLRGTTLLYVVGAASGALGGFYGLGGAVLAAPATLLLTGWPVARVSGAALVTTLTVSVTGLATYAALDLAGHTAVTTPNWPLGLALGAGGVAGGYLGARLAGRLPDRLLRVGLATLVSAGALRLVLVT
ncbi:anion permease [Phytohabitans rumicis]|uniref:Probable membrane transporter protein n=1 Tax=Phytohabitans rumicis TaxID=1076125 RepID=A0A6V8L8S8_9ACTN|nr:anion permease [Phytohabitans rumicis]